MEQQAAAPQGITVSQAAQQFEALMDSDPSDNPHEQEAEQEEVSSEAQADEVDAVGDEQTEDSPRPTYRVKVDGEEVEVPLDELLKGYSRTTDYTRKTMQAAELRKAAEAEQSAARQERAQYQQMLSALAANLKQNEARPPDEQLRAMDPVAYSVQWADYQRNQEQQRLVAAEQARLAEMSKIERSQHIQRHLAQEHEHLVSAIPEWKDDEKARAEKKAIAQFAESVGYKPDELANLFDHRAVVLMRKAMLYDQLTKSTPQPSKVASQKTLAPGNARSGRPVTDVTRAKQRLAQTGRVRDAAAVFERLLGD